MNIIRSTVLVGLTGATFLAAPATCQETKPLVGSWGGVLEPGPIRLRCQGLGTSHGVNEILERLYRSQHQSLTAEPAAP